MKKIYCDYSPNDSLRVSTDETDAFIVIKAHGERCDIMLSPNKIRKLRKQLKKALLRIEGVKEKWKEGDKVFLIHGDGEGPDHSTSPSTHGIDLQHPVTLKHLEGGKRWVISYINTYGENVGLGYASEHSFGKRAD